MSTKTKTILPKHRIDGKLCKKLAYQRKKASLKSKIAKLDYEQLLENKPHGNSKNYVEKYEEWLDKRENLLLETQKFLKITEKCFDVEKLIHCEHVLFSIAHLIDRGETAMAIELAVNTEDSISSYIELSSKDSEVIND